MLFLVAEQQLWWVQSMWACHKASSGIKFKGSSSAKKFESSVQTALRQYELVTKALTKLARSCKNHPDALALVPDGNHDDLFRLRDNLQRSVDLFLH